MSFSTRKQWMLGIPLVIAACSSAQSDGGPPLIEPPTSNAPTGPQPEFGALVKQADPPPPISGGTLAVDRTLGIAVAADSDRDRVYVVDLPTRTVRHTIQLAHKSEPGRVALDTSGRAHVALRNTGELATIDLATGAVSVRAACTAPRGVTYDKLADKLYVACATGDLLTFAAGGGAPLLRASFGRDLRDVVIVNKKLRMSRFRDAHLVNPAPDLTVAEPESQLGTSNLAWRAISAPADPSDDSDSEKEEATAVVAQDPSQEPVRVEAGGYGSSSMGLGSTCQGVGIVSTRLFRLDSHGASGSVRIPDAVLPVDLASNGREFVVIAAGNAHTKQLAQIFVVQGHQLKQGTQECVPMVQGTVPGQAISAGFDHLDELIVQTREPAALHIMTADRRRPWKTIPLATESREDTGHAIFHSNAGGNIACASCHAEGADDGRTWEFVDMGPRRTPSLLGTTPNTEPFHWSGDMKDLQTLVDHVFVERMSGPKIDKKQVDTLGNYIFTLPAPPKLRNEADVPVRGKELFEKRCASCHSGAIMTNNKSVDVGTGGVFQVPSLVGVGWRAPFLHSGCATTLFDRFDPKCGSLTHGDTKDLARDQIADMVSYLETL